MTHPDFWNDQSKAQTVINETNALKDQVNQLYDFATPALSASSVIDIFFSSRSFFTRSPINNTTSKHVLFIFDL